MDTDIADQSSRITRDLPSREVTHTIIGNLYRVWNELGAGHRERYYQIALAELLTQQKMPFRREVSFPIQFQGKTIGRQQLDFLIDGSLVVELKVARMLNTKYLAQVLAYLKASQCHLALIALFTPDGVRIKRVIDTQGSSVESVKSASIGVSVAL